MPTLTVAQTVPVAPAAVAIPRHKRNPNQAVNQAFRILHVGYVVLPLLAGLDKYFHFLVNWNIYLAQSVRDILPIPASQFMRVVGGVEILAAFVVWRWPRVGGLIVAAWLLGIIANLLMVPGFYDIAARDLGLCLGALALSRLSAARRS